MRSRKTEKHLKVRAIAGTHVVTLAWDFAGSRKAAIKRARDRNLLGFAIRRAELDAAGAVVERYMLRGIKRFEHKDEGQPAGAQMPTNEHPIQTFQWGDYTVKPGVAYDYTVIPVTGRPKLLEVEEERSCTVRVTTEPERAPGTGRRHDVWFNRGVIGSQAYARKFANAEPDPDQPASAPMKWLSRGLFEALLDFIAQARDDHWTLHAAFYEFRYLPVARAFRAALDRGANVRIVYDAESSYKQANRETLAASGLDALDAGVPRTVTEGIRHNKFIVLLKDGVPVSVWTGSTNVSDGGIFGHSNVGHVVHDKEIARQYHDYWERLALNLTPTQLRAPNVKATPLPAGSTAKAPLAALFSPRDKDHDDATLRWYADRMAEAKRMVCFTVAFDIDSHFQAVLARDNDVLRWVVKDDELSTGEDLGRDRDVLFAAGGRFDPKSALANFLVERGNPLNSNDYIHTKLMLVDPLGAEPLVISGSANFSRASQQRNDENMLVIRGDRRVADIYFGEFMRIFDHHYSRYVARKLAEKASGDGPHAGYLKEQVGDWIEAHLDDDSPKGKRRRYFLGL